MPNTAVCPFARTSVPTLVVFLALLILAVLRSSIPRTRVPICLGWVVEMVAPDRQVGCFHLFVVRVSWFLVPCFLSPVLG